MDAYMAKHLKGPEQQLNLSNLLQTWTHCLLYHKCIYPKDAFAERELLGVSVQAASSPPLKDYLDGFFEQLRPHLAHLNHLQILILTPQNQLIEANTLHIDAAQRQEMVEEREEDNWQSPNKLQRDIQLKEFLHDLTQRLAEGFIRTD